MFMPRRLINSLVGALFVEVTATRSSPYLLILPPQDDPHSFIADPQFPVDDSDSGQQQ